jgi:FKBP-type peptidyl-prolyl cis-trans isomerase SlyD
MNITKNRVVSIDYTLKDKNNQLIDSTSGTGPLDYLHGYKNIIPGLERALEGKARGDVLKVKVPAEDAYGERDAQLVISVPLERFGSNVDVKVGMQFQAQTSNGYSIVTVTEVGDETVTVDGNHPLAGMDLNFDVTVTGVREASLEEMNHGHVHSAHSHECCGGCGGCGGCGAAG